MKAKIAKRVLLVCVALVIAVVITFGRRGDLPGLASRIKPSMGALKLRTTPDSSLTDIGSATTADNLAPLSDAQDLGLPDAPVFAPPSPIHDPDAADGLIERNEQAGGGDFGPTEAIGMRDVAENEHDQADVPSLDPAALPPMFTAAPSMPSPIADSSSSPSPLVPTQLEAAPSLPLAPPLTLHVDAGLPDAASGDPFHTESISDRAEQDIVDVVDDLPPAFFTVDSPNPGSAEDRLTESGASVARLAQRVPAPLPATSFPPAPTFSPAITSSPSLKAASTTLPDTAFPSLTNEAPSNQPQMMSPAAPIAGPRRENLPQPSRTAARDVRLHRVIDGDTLDSISQRYLGSPAGAQEIFQANRQLLQDPEVLPLGVRLVVPVPAEGEVMRNRMQPPPLPQLRPVPSGPAPITTMRQNPTATPIPASPPAVRPLPTRAPLRALPESRQPAALGSQPPFGVNRAGQPIKPETKLVPIPAA